MTRIYTRTPVMDRFWNKVQKTDTCWLWVGAISSNGYGQIWQDSHQASAHRAIWEHLYGPIPTGMMLCHRCDVRNCVNPAHLFLGTQSDNIKDMYQKGRGHIGADHARAKLNAVQVQQMRELSTEEITVAELARRFHISESQAARVVRHETWTHLP